MEPQDINLADVKHFGIENAASPVVVESEPNVLEFSKGWVVADSKPMRDGSIQDVASMDIDRFQTNPVFLKDHNWSVDGIIGRVEDIRKEKGGVLKIYKVRMASAQHAQEVKRLILDRMVRDTSTGLLVGQYDQNEEGNLVYKDSELVEISVVMTGNNYASRLNQLSNQSTMENETPTQETPETPAAPAETPAETPATPAAEAPAASGEEISALKNRIAELEAKQNTAVRPNATTPKETTVENEISSAQLLHGQLSALKRGDRQKLAELNEKARATHEARVAGMTPEARRNALDFGDTSLVPSAELLAAVRKPAGAWGVLVPFVRIMDSLMKTAVTYNTSPGYIDFVDDATFCAEANASDPTYTLKTLTLVRKSAATVICRDLDTVSPVALEADVTEQLRNGALREYDQVIVAAILGASGTGDSEIDTSTAADVFEGIGNMPVDMPASYPGDGSGLAYITTWGNLQKLKAWAATLTNPSLSTELSQGSLFGYPVRVVPNGTLPAWNAPGDNTGWIAFGDLRAVTLGRWENIMELDVRTDGTVAGVNLTATNSVALIGRMHVGAQVDFPFFVMAIAPES